MALPSPADQEPTAPSAQRRNRLAVVIGTLAVTLLFALTATWGAEGQTRDSLGAALPGWSLVERGTLDLTDYSDYDAWLVETSKGWFSNRAPGLIAVSAIGYLVSSPFTSDLTFWPATLMAVLMSGIAVGLLASAARHLGVTWAFWPVIIVGAGTALWGIASDQLWPHGPVACMIALAVWSLAKDRNWLAGVSLGIALLIRPPVAVVAAVLGVGLAICRRSLRPLIQLGLPAAIAAGVYLIYNKFIFDSWSPVASYNSTGGLTTSSESIATGANKILIALMSPRYGILVWSPWIVLGLVCLHRGWARLPDWARLLPLTALLYLLVHVQLNRVSGGLPYNYRYAIPAVALVSPVLIYSLWGARDDRAFRALSVLTVLVAVGLQATFVFVSECSGIGTAHVTCQLFGL
jgi:hypothetical protein